VTGENIVSSGSQQDMDNETENDQNDANSEDGYIGEFSRDYINAEIFKLFDVDGSGKITKEDLDQVAK